jgi:hypothetical protein
MLYLLGILLVVSAVALFVYFPKTQLLQETPTFDEALKSNATGDPAPLQEYFVSQLKNGTNDDSTKSAIYWITHRYFDNEGDIYEIYNFIESHPEVAFLKEAEQIYPDIFEKIKTSHVEGFSYESLMALLAYYDTIDAHEYGGIALWGLAANKYSEQAYKNTPHLTDSMENAQIRKKYFDLMADRATDYTTKVRMYLIDHTSKTGDLKELLETGMQPDDLLVGLNQYASALLNLKGAGVSVSSDLSPRQIFEFNSQFALDYVPRLYAFTNYLYATALVYGKEATTETVTPPLERIVTYAGANETWRTNGTLNRILNSRTSNESGLYDKNVTVTLADLNPTFKAWLLKNGWAEADFE